MQGREAAHDAPPHPAIAALCCKEVERDSAEAAFGEPAGPGLPLWLDTASGEALTEAPPQLRGVLGGLCADEPGLGKTITAVGTWLRCSGRGAAHAAASMLA